MKGSQVFLLQCVVLLLLSATIEAVKWAISETYGSEATNCNGIPEIIVAVADGACYQRTKRICGTNTITYTVYSDNACTAQTGELLSFLFCIFLVSSSQQ